MVNSALHKSVYQAILPVLQTKLPKNGRHSLRPHRSTEIWHIITIVVSFLHAKLTISITHNSTEYAIQFITN